MSSEKENGSFHESFEKNWVAKTKDSPRRTKSKWYDFDTRIRIDENKYFFAKLLYGVMTQIINTLRNENTLK